MLSFFQIESLSNFTPWLALVVGIAFAIATLEYTWQMRRSTVAVPILLIAMGMLAFLSGFMAVFISWSKFEVQKIVHDTLYIAGFILLLSAAYKLKSTSFNKI